MENRFSTASTVFIDIESRTGISIYTAAHRAVHRRVHLVALVSRAGQILVDFRGKTTTPDQPQISREEAEWIETGFGNHINGITQLLEWSMSYCDCDVIEPYRPAMLEGLVVLFMVLV